ncbi:MAG: protein kinase [Vicinamibacterales bacterium]
MDLGEALVGQLVDTRYRLVRLLGEGAFGLVFEAEHIAGAEVIARVALKLIRHSVGAGSEQYAELKHGLALNHQNIVRCYSAGDTFVSLNGRRVSVLFVAMELADYTLAARLRQSRLGHAEAVAMTQDVASGLAYLLKSDLAHRDLKPSNVLNVGGRWKIADFGLSAPLDAGRTAARDAAGTLPYQPPESLESKVSPAGDCWSLGALLLEALTGQLPFDAASTGEWLYLLKTAEPQLPPGLPEPFDRIIAGCLQRNRAARSTPQQVLEAVRVRPDRQEPNTRAYCVVAPEGGHYNSVATAVRRAAPWSRVLVKPGVYKGPIVLNEPIELIALGASADVVLDGGNQPALVINTSDAMVRGFTLRMSAPSSRAKAAVEVLSGQSLLDLCEVLTAAAACLHVASRKARPYIRRCRFHGGRHEAVIFDEDAEGTLDDCQIRAAPRTALALRDKANPVVRRCQVVASGFRGVHVGERARGIVEDCVIEGGGGPAIELSRHCQPIIRKTRVVAGADVAIQAASGAKAILAECTIVAPEGQDLKLGKGHQIQRLNVSHVVEDGGRREAL